MATKTIRVVLDESTHEELSEKKDGRTWLEVLEDGAEVGGE